MSGRQVRRPVSDTAKPIIPLAANATNSVPLFLGAFAPLLVVVAVPILFRADMPSVAANSTLNCYDSAGNYEPCVPRAECVPITIKWPNNRGPSTSKLDNKRALSTSNLANNYSRSTSKLDNKRSRSTSRSRTISAPAARRSSTPAKPPSHLRATFDTMLLLRLAEGAYAYCICCCNRGAAVVKPGNAFS